MGSDNRKLNGLGRQKHGKKRVINRLVDACRFAYRTANKAIVPGRQDAFFVRQAAVPGMRLDDERFQAIVRNLQASKERSNCLAAFQQRLTWRRCGPGQSLKLIDPSPVGTCQGRSEYRTAFCRSGLIDAFHTLPTNVGWSKRARLEIQIPGEVLA